MKRVIIAGSSGFIGSNLVAKKRSEGYFVIGIDIEKPKYYEPDLFVEWDMRASVWAISSAYQKLEKYKYEETEEAYCLACLMGGMGYIGDEQKHGYDIAIGSTEIVANFIGLCNDWNVKKVFYSSSACVYNQDLQWTTHPHPLKEADAIPANPDLLYGWQKLYAEKMFMASGLDVRIARFHNVFGKWGTYDGGKEKAPAALTRKVCQAKDGDEIEVWGTGEQSRSFLHIDEALEGVARLMQSNYNKPINIGSSELIKINNLAKMAIEISGKKLTIKNVEGNVGVMGRNSDNTLIYSTLGWKPTKPLREGMEKLFEFINGEINGGL